MSIFYKTNAVGLKTWLCVTTAPLVAFSCVIAQCGAASLGGVVQDRVRKRQERLFCRKPASARMQRSLVATLLLVLSFIAISLKDATALLEELAQ
jgi:hypothetical protein